MDTNIIVQTTPFDPVHDSFFGGRKTLLINTSLRLKGFCKILFWRHYFKLTTMCLILSVRHYNIISVFNTNIQGTNFENIHWRLYTDIYPLVQFTLTWKSLRNSVYEEWESILSASQVGMVCADLQERVKLPTYHLQLNWKPRRKGINNILTSVRGKLKTYKYIWIFSDFFPFKWTWKRYIMFTYFQLQHQYLSL